jgi:hypothetical protein
MPDQAIMDLAPGIRIAWDDLDAIRAGLTEADSSTPWRLEGELGTDHTALRVLTGTTDKGALLLLAGARPNEADGHDAENPQAVIVSGSGDVKVISEALMSTQFSASGAIERVGLELYGEGDDYPVRGAGDATQTSATEEGELRHEQARLAFRLDGEPGAAILDILHS